MNRNDYLWKGILENVADDFLRFFFRDADSLFDLDRGFAFLDKELADLFPDEEALSPKFVDKLIKVFTKATEESSSEEKWVLVHVEIQGYRDNSFPSRMHTYFYRILDRYRQSVTAIAIFTDRDRKYRPEFYKYDFLGTSLIFRFNTYKVLDQDEETLRNDSNPFAAVILTVLMTLRKKELSDQELFEMKRGLLRNLLHHRVSASKIDKLIIFLQVYVQFKDQDYARQFEQEINEITKNDRSMGIRELVLDHAEKIGIEKGLEQGIEKGLEQGIEEGIAKGIEKGIEKTARNLVKSSILTNAQIASALEVSVEYVVNIRKEMDMGI
ncbi:putative transposase YdaD [Dyadobacter jejuensis]|uniref:Putative transposase YdaD n=1 Tax=Dyadobacter jejuensis TaxID=1082580 RepID=A0A316AK27_9BACT|nr:hypothetical protein [Dyadobacter jejuensis]PWJ57951.1 putative transposase YdaD [Dyadobacter jejuensis]